MQQQYFADKLSEKMATPSVRPKIPQRTAAVDGNDAVDILRNFCVQHEYPLPTCVHEIETHYFEDCFVIVNFLMTPEHFHFFSQIPNQASFW